MDTISDNLIHFLGRTHIQSPSKQFEIFTSIIENGLRTGNISVAFPASGVIHNSIVCFTDLPLKFCDRHTALYGKFGIGFKKSYIKNVGGNPAMYFVDHSPTETNDATLIETRGIAGLNFGAIQRFILKLSKQVNLSKETSMISEGEVIITNEELVDLQSSCLYALSFLKEIGDLGVARDESEDIDPYYKEREWRLVPSKGNEINKTIVFDKEKNTCHYKFNRKDVNCIIVPDIDMRKKVNNYLNSFGKDEQQHLKEFTEDPPPVFVYDDLRRW